MVVCLAGARFNMKADILRATEVSTPPDETDPDGEWVSTQDPDSGEIIREWVPGTNDPTDPDYRGMTTFKCMARGIIDGGIRVAGTTERFGELYEGVDYIRIWFSPKLNITRRDRITNVRTNAGKVLWREEERLDQAPTVFSVVGVTPIIDPFGNHTQSVALLERVEGQ